MFYRCFGDTWLWQKGDDIPSPYLHFHRLSSAERCYHAVDNIREHRHMNRLQKKKLALRAMFKLCVPKNFMP